MSASSQSLGVRRTSPAWGFGAATREAVNKLFISQAHTLTIMHGQLSPGPAHYTYARGIGQGKESDATKPDPPEWQFNKSGRFLSSLTGKLDQRPGPEQYRVPTYIGGMQPDGTKANEPRYGFGSSTRAQHQRVFISQKHTLTILAGTESPGPSNYEVQGTFGAQHQPNARMRNQPMFSIASTARTPLEAGVDTPGPAKYDKPRGCGQQQPDSKQRSEPSWRFGSTARTPVGAGGDSPGPAVYNMPSANGPQPNARKRSSPVVSFSRYSRWADHEREQRKNSVPGPGHYG